jgi:hypothetical protein
VICFHAFEEQSPGAFYAIATDTLDDIRAGKIEISANGVYRQVAHAHFGDLVTFIEKDAIPGDGAGANEIMSAPCEASETIGSFRSIENFGPTPVFEGEHLIGSENVPTADDARNGTRLRAGELTRDDDG